MTTQELIDDAQALHDEIDKALAALPKQPPLLLQARRAAEMVLGHLGGHDLVEKEAAADAAAKAAAPPVTMAMAPVPAAATAPKA